MTATHTAKNSQAELRWSKNWPAPAKLNLFLHIMGRRDDGYHELQTVFQMLSYGDVLHFGLRNDGQISRSRGPVGVAAEDDLTVRAAQLLKDRVAASVPNLGVDIVIDKRLPMGGGLGGGSSNAATVLVALNKLWKTGLSTDELAALGLSLGADVPVFVRGLTAAATGVGENLEPLSLSQPWYLVVTPDCHVSTAEVFQHPELTRNTAVRTIRASLEGGGQNDCVAVVRKLHPQVADTLDKMALLGAAKMTGTGASVFIEFTTLLAATEALAVARNYGSAFVARGLNQSELLARSALADTD